MKLKTLLAIIAISTIGFIGGGLSTFNNLNAVVPGDDAENPFPIPDPSTTELTAGYYKLTGTLTYLNRITIIGTVQIELANDAIVTITKGIQCAEGCELTITGDDAGQLTITTPDSGNAGIGGNLDDTVGILNIKGGTILAQGGFHAAGIGGGTGGNGGIIKIEGGTISATGGNEGAGIGGGEGHNGGEITITGGDITATGSEYAAGIGGGEGAANGIGGTINIEGGKITATGGSNAAGIGGGYACEGGTITISGGEISSIGGLGAAGIGGGYYGDGGTITISGGTITAEDGGEGSAGIGVGEDGYDNGTTQITGGSINTGSINPAPTSNGSTPVYKNTLTAVGFNESFITAYYNLVYGINDIYTDESGTVYFYLPISGAALLALSFDPVDNSEEYYGVTYARTDDTGNNTKTLERIKLPTPLANIDYENEKLIDLISDTNYDISVQLAPQSLSLLSLEPYSHAQQNGNTQSDIDGETRIDESWMGNSIDIVQTRIAIPIGDSDPQNLEISPRPEATPELKALVTSTPESEGNKGKISGLKVGMAYSTNPNAAPSSWTNVDSEDDLELAPGTYYFRVISDGEHFATEAVEVVIPVFPAPVAPDSPADSQNPGEINLPATGLNLDLPYILMVLLLACGTVLKKRVILVPKK